MGILPVLFPSPREVGPPPVDAHDTLASKQERAKQRVPSLDRIRQCCGDVDNVPTPQTGWITSSLCRRDTPVVFPVRPPADECERVLRFRERKHHRSTPGTRRLENPDQDPAFPILRRHGFLAPTRRIRLATGRQARLVGGGQRVLRRRRVWNLLLVVFLETGRGKWLGGFLLCTKSRWSGREGAFNDAHPRRKE